MNQEDSPFASFISMRLAYIGLISTALAYTLADRGVGVSTVTTSIDLGAL